MLPRPVTTSVPRFIRSRVSIKPNAVFLLLLGLLFLSLAANYRQYSRQIITQTVTAPGDKASIETSFENASHLIIVAGHAVWTGCKRANAIDDANWILESHQKGSTHAFWAHILKGIELFKADPHAVLIFSGGLTRRQDPTRTEAQSYLALSIATGLLDAQSRAFTEDYALDSFQNLIFGLARYHELATAAGKAETWPKRITVVGFEMKRRRFEQLHRMAIRFPTARFEYVGVDIEEDDDDDDDDEKAIRQTSWQGEEKYGYIPYSQDLYGCHSQLAAKRKSRNPFARSHPYHRTNPELSSLLDWCPSSMETSLEAQLFPGPLPWDLGR